MNTHWKTRRFVRMWPRALFHMKEGTVVLKENLKDPGVYILYSWSTPIRTSSPSTGSPHSVLGLRSPRFPCGRDRPTTLPE